MPDFTRLGGHRRGRWQGLNRCASGRPKFLGRYRPRAQAGLSGAASGAAIAARNSCSSRSLSTPSVPFRISQLRRGRCGIWSVSARSWKEQLHLHQTEHTERLPAGKISAQPRLAFWEAHNKRGEIFGLRDVHQRRRVKRMLLRQCLAAEAV